MRNPKILVLDRSQALADQVRSVLDGAQPRPEVVACQRVGAVGEVLAGDGPFEVLVAGPSLGTKAGLARLQDLHDDAPGMATVLAFEARPEARLRDIVRTGAVDLVQMPVDDGTLLDSLNRAVELGVHQARDLALAGAHPDRRWAAGRVFTISSATGGCGKTFYATNLAYFLSQHSGKRACIVDLDLQFGEVSTALRLRPRFTIFDALERGDADDVDLRTHIEDYVVRHDTGVHVLAAPKDPSEADRISPPDVARVIEAVRARFDYVVVDTPAALSEVVLAAFDMSDQLFVMATLDLPSVRNMAVFLNTLEKLKIPHDNVQLVLNKEESDVGISVAQVARMLPKGFSSVLPYSRDVSRSINAGMPVLGYSPRGDVSRRLVEGMRPLLPEGTGPVIVDHHQARAGFFGRLFGRNVLPQPSRP